MQDFSGNLIETLSRLAFPKIGIIDIIQIALIAFFVYQFMVWIKYTHAYTLLKGILVVLLFILIAYIFRMNTILWIFSNLASTLIVGVIVIFQPELRKVLEQLGQKRIMASLIPFDAGKEVKERFTDKTISELVKACFDMGEVKTGALIVIEQNELLTDYIRTGINLDAILTSQLLINIVKEYELSPKYFQFEITETVATEYSESFCKAVEDFTNAGIGLCLDDFGSGYANLNAVLRLPFDVVKMDRSLLTGITCDEQAAVFYHSIVTVMQNMGYTIVAEGAETEEEVSLLREWGVDMVQGYYFSRPLPEAELLRLFML